MSRTIVIKHTTVAEGAASAGFNGEKLTDYQQKDLAQQEAERRRKIAAMKAAAAGK